MPAHPTTSEMTYDLLIQNGTVVSVFTGETFPADVAIRGETIAAVLAPGSVDPGQAAEVRRRDRADRRARLRRRPHARREQLRHPGLVRLADPAAGHHHGPGRSPRDRQRGRQARPALDDRGRPGAPARPSSTASRRACRRCSASRRPAPSSRPDDVSEMLDWPGVIGLGEVMDYRAVVRGRRADAGDRGGGPRQREADRRPLHQPQRQRAERLPRRGDRLRPHQEPGRDPRREGPDGHAGR